SCGGKAEVSGGCRGVSMTILAGQANRLASKVSGMSRFVDTMIASATSAGGSRRGIFTGEPHEPQHQTWDETHPQARRFAAGLVAAGLKPGQSVGVLAAAPVVIAPTVQAVWLAGGSVTMLHQPTPRTDLAEWASDTVRVLRMIGSHLVLLGDPFDQ